MIVTYWESDKDGPCQSQSMERISRREFLKLSALFTIGISTPEIKVPCRYFNSGDPKSEKVAITVDDGWFPDIVEKMAEKSIELNLPISTFPVGSVILQSPDLWRDIKKRGFEIYNHTQNHKDLGTLDSKKIEEQLTKWEETYQKTFGEEYAVKIIRPPFGNGIDKSLFTIADRLNYQGIAGWKVGSQGYSSSYSPEEIWEMMKDKIVSGSIILLHFVQNDLEILPRIADLLEEKKLKAVPLSQLPGTPIYNPIQPRNIPRYPDVRSKLHQV